jgi:hypothetical protein
VELTVCQKSKTGVKLENKLEDSDNQRMASLALLLKRLVFRIIAKNELEITLEQWVVIYYLGQENGDVASQAKSQTVRTHLGDGLNLIYTTIECIFFIYSPYINRQLEILNHNHSNSSYH